MAEDAVQRAPTRWWHKLAQLFRSHRKLERELESMRGKAAGSAVAELADQAREIDGIKLVAARVARPEGQGAARGHGSTQAACSSDGVVLLASGDEGKASLVAGVQGRALRADQGR